MNFPPALPGRVYLIGAGPGDPGLLTLKGAHYLGQADIVLYDGLLDERLLDLAPAHCEKIHVGKRGGGPGTAQEEIHRLLVHHAHQQQRVIRLKGGDPYVFGRGGEEALILAQAGIAYEIVSGVSAASGVPTYAGIPLTHRGLSATAVLVTGSEDPNKATPPVDWEKLAQLKTTLVIFMAGRKLAQITADLQAHGLAKDTPAAAIEWGTWPRQRSIDAPLENLAAAVENAALKPPVLTVIGAVVSLRNQLNWFEDKPLFGRKVLVTRSREQAGDLRLQLEAEGATVFSLPLLEIQAPEDGSPLDAALDRLSSFAWIVFASPNGVDFFFRRLHQRNLDSRALGSNRIAVVGQATAEHLRAHGLRPDLVPTQQTQEGLVEAFVKLTVDGQTILLPGSSIGRPLLAKVLEKRGAQVHRVTTYTNQPPAQFEPPPALLAGEIDLVVFASPSSFENFVSELGHDRSLALLAASHIACIGPTTARAVRNAGLEVHIQPEQSSISALITAICAHYHPPTS